MTFQSYFSRKINILTFPEKNLSSHNHLICLPERPSKASFIATLVYLTSIHINGDYGCHKGPSPEIPLQCCQLWFFLIWIQVYNFLEYKSKKIWKNIRMNFTDLINTFYEILVLWSKLVTTVSTWRKASFFLLLPYLNRMQLLYLFEIVKKSLKCHFLAFVHMHNLYPSRNWKHFKSINDFLFNIRTNIIKILWSALLPND